MLHSSPLRNYTIYYTCYQSVTYSISKTHTQWRDFSVSPVLKILHFPCRWHRFNPWSGNWDPTLRHRAARNKTKKETHIVLYYHLQSIWITLFHKNDFIWNSRVFPALFKNVSSCAGSPSCMQAFPSGGERELFSSCGAWAYHCRGFSWRRAQALAFVGFSSCDAWV